MDDTLYNPFIKTVSINDLPDGAWTYITGRREDRDDLQKQLTRGQLDLEGKRLLKLTAVEPGRLYARLGLRPGDVLIQVNGQWIHDQHNPLWEALQTQHVVTVTIIRKGFPKTYEYVIDNASTAPHR